MWKWCFSLFVRVGFFFHFSLPRACGCACARVRATLQAMWGLEWEKAE